MEKQNKHTDIIGGGKMKYKLSELFANCAWKVKYTNVKDWVSYAFVEEEDTLYIYFQGSNEINDWVANFLFKKRPYKDMGIPYRVHRGFLAAWKEVEDIVIAKIKEGEPDFKWKHIIVVGYSHGGALAAFCHECAWFWRPDLREDGLVGYGFEAPRIFGGFYVPKKLKERWATFTVVRNNHDVVTYCPPCIFRFCHVGDIKKIHGDTSLVQNKLPKFVKSHFPEAVHDGLLKDEAEKKAE